MKNKFLIFSIFTTFFLLSTPAILAQDISQELEEKEVIKVRPFRVGVKLGFPNVIGGNLEYVTPLLGKKLAVNADYSMINSDWLLKPEDMGEGSQQKLDYSYLDIGLNYYFFKPGKGLYGGISYSSIKAEATMPDSESVEYIKESHGSFNVKLGAKLGGLFYFRPEIGYSFKPLPKKYDVLTVYNDGTTETRTDDWSDAEGPADIIFNGLIANIGIGFAF